MFMILFCMFHTSISCFLTTDARERAEHDRVEESEAQGEGVFMN